MPGIVLLLLVGASFGLIATVAVLSALRAGQVEDVIGEIFSTWLRDPFGASGAVETTHAGCRDDAAMRRA